MTQPTPEYVEQVIDLLAGVPNRACHEVFEKASCLSQTRICLDVLEHFGIEAMPLPVTTQVHNDLHMMALRNDWLAIPGQVTVRVAGSGENRVDDRGSWWDGHMVLWVPSARTLVDPTIGQFGHTEVGIPLPDGIVLRPPPELVFDVTDPDSILAFEGDEGQVVEYRPLVDIDHDSWRKSDAWASNDPMVDRLVILIIDYIEETLSGKTDLDIIVEHSPIGPYGFAIHVGPAVRKAPNVGRRLAGPDHRAALAAAAGYHRD